MTRILTVNTWVGIREGCSLGCQVLGNDDVEFTVGGGGHEPFEIVFDAPTLREFVRLSTEALGEMGAESAQEQTEPTGDS